MQNKKSILIVDDDQLFSKAIQGLLEGYGYAVLCCHNGLDAIKLSKERSFDMILTDYHMPGMTGDLVCRSIREERPDAYIVGFSTASKNRAFISAGATMSITKDDLIQNFPHFLSYMS